MPLRIVSSESRASEGIALGIPIATRSPGSTRGLRSKAEIVSQTALTCSSVAPNCIRTIIRFQDTCGHSPLHLRMGRGWGRGESDLPEDQGHVVAAEPERVGQRDVDLGLASLVRDIVKIALRIRVLVVYGRRDDPIAHRQ